MPGWMSALASPLPPSKDLTGPYPFYANFSDRSRTCLSATRAMLSREAEL